MPQPGRGHLTIPMIKGADSNKIREDPFFAAGILSRKPSLLASRSGSIFPSLLSSVVDGLSQPFSFFTSVKANRIGQGRDKRKV